MQAFNMYINYLKIKNEGKYNRIIKQIGKFNQNIEEIEKKIIYYHQ